MEEKKKGRKPKALKVVPEWAKGMEGVELMLDGLTYHISHDAHEEGCDCHKGKAPIPSIPEDYLNSMGKERDKMLEIVCGCMVAYLSAMATLLENEQYHKIVQPLPDVIAKAMANAGLVSPISKEEYDKLNNGLKEYAKAKGIPMGEDKDGFSLEKALRELKGIAKGMIH